jgi:hypothetical protein
MTTLFKLFVWLLRIVVFVGLFGLAIKNSGPMELRFFLDQAWTAPVSAGDPCRFCRRRRGGTYGGSRRFSPSRSQAPLGHGNRTLVVAGPAGVFRARLDSGANRHQACC